MASRCPVLCRPIAPTRRSHARCNIPNPKRAKCPPPRRQREAARKRPNQQSSSLICHRSAYGGHAGRKRSRAHRRRELAENQLGMEYGDHATLKWLNFRTAVLLANVDAEIYCNRDAFSKNLAFWSWKRSTPPTDPQLDWFERFYRCHEADRSKPSATPGKQAPGPAIPGPQARPRILQETIRNLAERNRGGRTGQGQGKTSILHGQDFAIACRWRSTPQALKPIKNAPCKGGLDPPWPAA